jgi:hypothetical protein
MATCRLLPLVPAVIERGVALASPMLRVSILMPAARCTVATGMAVFLTTPPDTAKRVAGVVCRNMVEFCCAEIRAELTFVPMKRFIGTKTYCVELTTTALPEYPDAPKTTVGGNGAQPT